MRSKHPRRGRPQAFPRQRYRLTEPAAHEYPIAVALAVLALGAGGLVLYAGAALVALP